MNPLTCGYIHLQENKIVDKLSIIGGFTGGVTGVVTNTLQSRKLHNKEIELAKLKNQKIENNSLSQNLKNAALGVVPIVGALNNNKLIEKRERIENQIKKYRRK